MTLKAMLGARDWILSVPISFPCTPWEFSALLLLTPRLLPPQDQDGSLVLVVVVRRWGWGERDGGEVYGVTA